MSSASRAALVRPGWQAAAGGRAPHARRGRAEDLVPLRDRERQLVQRGAQPFEQQCAPILVGPQQPGAAVAAGQPQDRYLVPGVITGARDVHLQDRRRAVAQRGLGHERLRRVLDTTGPR